MPRLWEYKTETYFEFTDDCNSMPNKVAFRTWLNHHGISGWELCDVLHKDGVRRCTFKRMWR